MLASEGAARLNHMCDGRFDARSSLHRGFDTCALYTRNASFGFVDPTTIIVGQLFNCLVLQMILDLLQPKQTRCASLREPLVVSSLVVFPHPADFVWEGSVCAAAASG